MTIAEPGVTDALTHLIAPHTGAEFLARYFEAAPLHVARNDGGYFASLYGVADVEDALIVGGRERDKFALIKSGAPPVSTDEFSTERRGIRSRYTQKAPTVAIDPRTVMSYFERGYTLNIKDATLFHHGVQQLCNRLQAQLGFFVQANAYFTPPAAQGFEVHHDTHGVLILQIEGRKVWHVYDPVVPLPLETQPFSRQHHASQLSGRREIVMCPGDTLYIPHGFPHAAATGEERALHVTLAMSPPRAIDLLEAMLQLAAVSDVELRRGLPPGWHRDPAFAQNFAALLAERMPAAIAAPRVPLGTELVLNELFAVSRAAAGGAFDDVAALAALAPEHTICLRDDAPYIIRERGATLEVLLPGKSIGLPNTVLPALRRLEAGPASFAEIVHTLGDATARELAKLLVVEGLATIDAA